MICRLSALVVFFLFVGCQVPPTNIVEQDLSLEHRAFGKIGYGARVDLKLSVIIDTRSRFEHEMSKLPRSFHLYWKDVDLKGYSGIHLDEKKKSLQKFLALKGVDPHTRVVILGNGLSGQGEEFFVAASLLSLGIKKINFMDVKGLKKALTAKDIPPLENLPYWEEPLTYNFDCSNQKTFDFNISKNVKKLTAAAGAPKDVFNKNMSVKSINLPKRLNIKLKSPKAYWAYGLAIHLRELGRKPCVVR